MRSEYTDWANKGRTRIQGIQKASLGLAVLAALSLSAAHPALAAVTVGTDDGSGGNFVPFGGGPGTVPPLEYQQLYSPGAFSGITTINSVGFALDPALFNTNATGAASFTGTLKFAVVSNSLFSAPSTNFASNLGGSSSTVFSSTLNTTLLNNGSFDLVFPTTPFTYNPASGTLLLDVTLTSETLPAGANTANPEYFKFDGSGTSSSRVYTFGGTNTVSRSGLVTQFGTANVVPESSGAANMAGALLAVGFGVLVMRGRRKATVKKTSA